MLARSRTSRLRRGVLVAAIVGTAGFVFAAPAGAEVSGPCSGTIKNIDVAKVSSSKLSDAIKVGKTESIAVGAVANGTIDRYKIQLELGGRQWTVAKGSAKSNSWSRTVNVKTYARYGVGLYKVSGVSTGAANCTGAALVEVEGSALGSVAGKVAAFLSIIGVGAVGVSGIRGFICGPKPVQLIQSIQSMTHASSALPGAASSTMTAEAADIDRAYIADIKSPRGYVGAVEAICTYNPSRYRPMVEAICGNFRPRIESICRWG